MTFSIRLTRFFYCACALALAGAPLLSTASAKTRDEKRTQEPGERILTSEDLRALSWRSIGPANMGGRVSAIALSRSMPKTYFVGYATGGLWKTTNNGTTFSPVFDKEDTSSIGSVSVVDAPADWSGWEDDDSSMQDREEAGRAKIVWVGTGEGNGRNSSSWGNGVYRSTDGGGSFDHLGLKETHDIPALAVDPRDPDVCYIAALGHLWGANSERGIYKTDDGGETWDHVLEIDADTGACDVIVDHDDPDTVYAAMYERRRAPWMYRSGGETGGIFKSTNAGRSWTKLTEGLPSQTGRIGLAVAPSDADVVYAVVESDAGGKAGDPFDNRSRAGGIFRSTDKGESWERMGDFNPRAFYFSRISVDPADANRIYVLGWEVYVSDDGGKTLRAGVANTPHVDFHAIQIDPSDTDRILVGNDGGLYVSYDRGATWDFHNHMAVGQFYNVAVDDSDPYRVGGGLQDNGTWIGSTENIFQAAGDFMGRGGAITNNDWDFVLGGDGFHMAFDPTNASIVYAEWQGGNLSRIHLDTGETRALRPAAKEGQERYRFNWNAPFFVSAHEPTTLYLGGNAVFRLTDRGDSWEQISGDLTRREVDRIMTEGSNAETYGTLVSLAESPVESGILWAGSDDGLVHVSRDNGETWKDVTPADVDGMYVSRIETSSHDAGTAYVAVDGHRTDVFRPILLRTTNFGGTWRSIVGDLPGTTPIDVVRGDPANSEVLYVGTERGAYLTIDGGRRWIRMNGESLPTVPVDDLQIQVREMDMVAGTHGRSIWVLDDLSPISQLNDEVIASDLHLFNPVPARPARRLEYGGLWSDRMFIAPNPPAGGAISYWLRDHVLDAPQIQVKDASGHVVRELTGTTHPGINRLTWDLQADQRQRLGNADGMVEFVEPGLYTITISSGDSSMSATMEVLPPRGENGD